MTAESGRKGGDLPVDIGGATNFDDIRGIAALYPTKTTAGRAEMVRRNLAPEFLEHQNGARTILLARLGGRVVGTAQVVWNSDDPVLSGPGTAVIHHVRTHPDFRKRGIGTRLLHAATGLAFARGRERIALGVEPGNIRARRLYTALGFEPFREYRGEDGERLLAVQVWRTRPEGDA